MTIPIDPAPGSVPVAVTIERLSGAVVLVLSGEVNYLTSPAIKETVLTVLGDRPTLLVIDLLAVEFLGSAGLALLVEAAQRAKQYTTLRLVAAGPHQTVASIPARWYKRTSSHALAHRSQYPVCRLAGG